MQTLSKKVCLLGDFAVGKTSLVRRFVYDRFDDQYISTIGVKVSRKTLEIPHEAGLVNLTLMLWDLAGGEKFSALQPSYLRGAAGAILVCDLTRPQTLLALHGYITDIRNVNPQASLILAANKHDLLRQPESGDWYLSVSDVQTFAVEQNLPLYLTSAKSGSQVEGLFNHLGQLLAG